jgi:hypothetical protein
MRRCCYGAIGPFDGTEDMLKRTFITMLSAAAASTVLAEQGKRVLEIRTYTLKPGTRDHFHQLVVRDSLPMLERWKIDVVGFGPSLHDSDSYYLMRSFPSVKEREKIEESFYGSDEWKKGPREAILGDIKEYTTMVVSVDAATLANLRSMRKP